MMTKEEFKKRIGTKIKNMREEKGWKQYGLAKRSGVTTSVITNIEKAKFEPSSYTLYGIADAFKTTIDELVK